MRYDYECVKHGTVEVSKPMALAGRDEFCPDCIRSAERHHAVLPPPMRRLYGVGVLVQNHSVSDEAGGNLRSFGQHERLVQTNINDWIASERRRRLERESDN